MLTHSLVAMILLGTVGIHKKAHSHAVPSLFFQPFQRTYLMPISIPIHAARLFIDRKHRQVCPQHLVLSCNGEKRNEIKTKYKQCSFHKGVMWKIFTPIHTAKIRNDLENAK